jgi:hypothetical protein
MATTSPESARPTMDARETSVLVRFTPKNVSSEQYDETIRRLRTLGVWPPEGLDYHIAFGSNGDLRVCELWDSPQAFEAFASCLIPVLDDVGIELSRAPEILEVHNVVKR